MLIGESDFYRLQDGQEDWVRAEAGETMILPPNSLHGSFNRASSVCRLLGVSTAAHQTFSDAVAKVDRETGFARMDPSEVMGKIGAIALQNHYVLPTRGYQFQPQSRGVTRRRP